MKTKRLDIARWEWKWGLIFISPWLLGFLLFTLVPMVSSLGFSLSDFNPSNPDKITYVGAENWQRALFEDQETIDAVVKTMQFIAVSLPISFGFALILAILMNSKNLLGASLFKTLFYLPTMIPMVATTLIWSGILNAQTGWVNHAIQALTAYPAVGPQGILWMDSAQIIYITYSLISLWGVGNTMLIFLAGLQGVPTELYEAAEIDGAGWWVQMRRITLPMITPVIFFNLLMGVIGLLQYFAVPFVLTNGSGYPDGASNFIMVYFFRQSFTYFNMGYGSVLAWIIFIIGLVLTIILFASQKRWVYYAGEKK